jgi:hypothetical protein
MTVGIFGSPEGCAAELSRILESLRGGRSVFDRIFGLLLVACSLQAADAVAVFRSERSYF